MEKLNELASLQSQLKALTLQDKLGKQNFHEVLKNVLEPGIKSNNDVSEGATKTMMVTSEENNNALATLNHKFLKLLNDKVLQYLACRLTYLELLTQNLLVSVN